MKLKLSLLLQLLTLVLFFISCEKEKEQNATIFVEIEKQELNLLSFNLDSKNAETISYLFSEGEHSYTLEDIQESGESIDPSTKVLVFDDLKAEMIYTLSVVAYNEEGKASDIASLKASTLSPTQKEEVKIGIYKVIGTAVSYTIKSENISSIYYMLTEASMKPSSQEIIKEENKIEPNTEVSFVTTELDASKEYLISVIAINSQQKEVATEASFTTNTKKAYIEGKYLAEAVEVNGVYWAPVNCGFSEDLNPYGKLYQWGRIDGHSYDEAENESNGSGWLNSSDATLWGIPKTKYDPCPKGWRVPTENEYKSLGVGVDNSTHCAPGDDKLTPYGQSGRWFGKDHSNASIENSKNNIFLSYAGARLNNNNVLDRDLVGYYWSSTPFENASQYLILYKNEKSEEVAINSSSRADAFSIRCVEDKDYDQGLTSVGPNEDLDFEEGEW